MGIWFAMFGAAAAEKFQRIVEFWAIRPPSLLALGVFRALFCRCCDEYGHPASSHYRGYGWSQSKIAYMRLFRVCWQYLTAFTGVSTCNSRDSAANFDYPFEFLGNRCSKHSKPHTHFEE